MPVRHAEWGLSAMRLGGLEVMYVCLNVWNFRTKILVFKVLAQYLSMSYGSFPPACQSIMAMVLSQMLPHAFHVKVANTDFNE
jgi:hypothetical protein